MLKLSEKLKSVARRTALAAVLGLGGTALTVAPAAAAVHGGSFHGGGGLRGGGFGGVHAGFGHGGYFHGHYFGPGWGGWWGIGLYGYPYGYYGYPYCSYWDYYNGFCYY